MQFWKTHTEAVEDYKTQRLAEDPITFATSISDSDTMQYGEAMKADDAKEFEKTMLGEVDAHTTDKGQGQARCPLWSRHPSCRLGCFQT